MKSLSTIFFGLLHLQCALGHGYEGADFDGWYQPVPHRPVDIVTDVINDLGVRILQQYTAHGNVAFSPTGVGFILAALYEGSAGRGSQQIADALGLPRDRDISRIGFRDIHRRLRTYLNPDGFLGGLTLNQENTRLRPEYDDILRFYGFDLSDFGQEMNETTSTPEETTINVTTEPDKSFGNDETTTTTFTEETTTEEDISGETEGTTSQPSTTVSPVEEFETSNTASEQVRLTTIPISTEEMSSDVTTPAGTNFQTIEQDRTTTTEELPGTSTLSETVFTTMTPTTMSTPMSNMDGTETVPGITNESSTPVDVASTDNSQAVTTPSVNLPEEISTISLDSSVTITTVPGSTDALTSASTEGTDRMESGVSEPTTESTTTSEMIVNADEQQEGMSTTVSTSTIVSMSSINATTNDSSANDSTVQSSGTTGPETVPGSTTLSEDLPTDLPETTTSPTTTPSSSMDDSTNRIRKRSVGTPRGYFSSYPDEGIWMQDLGIWKPYSPGASEASVRDSTEISFLVNGCDVSSISASRYMAVLPFAYFPSLHAVALEFPLDDPRYNILLLMSTNRRDTYQLARDLGGKSLRLLRKQLQPTWVRATIPSFMLRGFVTLTSFLQRLGIVDVFEPRTADLSLMTPDLGVYVRDVQQSIGVNIRNYMKPDRTHSRNGLFERAGPVPFTAVHPFLYFIVDAETSVALIAGRVNDPLNSRIL